MEEKFLLGVYDNLRQEGDDNYAYMDGATYVGTYYTEPIFDLFALTGSYPGLKQGGSTSVLLEVFEVDKSILMVTDYYQGCNEHNPSVNMFNRIEIDTVFGRCFVYEYNKNVICKPRIESGDWFKHKKDVRDNLVKRVEERPSNWGEE